MVVTITLLLTSVLIGIVFPEIEIVFGFLGGIGCGSFVLFIPSKNYLALIKVKVSEFKPWQSKGIIGLFTLFTLIGFTGAILNAAGITT